MRFRSRLVQVICVTITMTFLASSVTAQVLPRNKNRRAETPPATAPSADRETTVRGEAQVEAGSSVSRTRSNVNILRTTQLVGTMVSIPGNQRWAKINDVVLNEQGCIWYVVVDINGRLAPVPWQVGNYDFRNRVFILDNIDQTRITRIPTFTKFEQLTEEKFVTQVNDFFNVRADAGVEGRNDTSIRAEEKSTVKEKESAEPKAKTRTKSDPSNPTTTDRPTDAQDKDPAPKTKEPTAPTKDPTSTKDPAPSKEPAPTKEPVPAKEPAPAKEPSDSTSPQKEPEDESDVPAPTTPKS